MCVVYKNITAIAPVMREVQHLDTLFCYKDYNRNFTDFREEGREGREGRREGREGRREGRREGGMDGGRRRPTLQALTLLRCCMHACMQGQSKLIIIVINYKDDHYILNGSS